MNSEILTVDEYIDKQDREVQSILIKIRKIIKDCAPKAQESIGYGMPAYKLNGPLVYFAAFKKHIGLYPTPSGIEKFKKDLEEYKNSKGSVQFPISKPIPYDLIKRIVEFRVQSTA